MKPFWTPRPEPERMEGLKHFDPGAVEDYEHLRRDIGQNYEGGFGSLLVDSPAGELDRTTIDCNMP